MVLHSWFKKKCCVKMHRGVRISGWAKRTGSVWAVPTAMGPGPQRGTRLRAPRNGVELSRQLGDGRKDGLPDASMRGERQALACRGDRLTRVWCTWAGPVWTPGEGGSLGLGPVVEIRSEGV